MPKTRLSIAKVKPQQLETRPYRTHWLGNQDNNQKISGIWTLRQTPILIGFSAYWEWFTRIIFVSLPLPLPKRLPGFADQKSPDSFRAHDVHAVRFSVFTGRRLSRPRFDSPWLNPLHRRALAGSSQNKRHVSVLWSLRHRQPSHQNTSIVWLPETPSLSPQGIP